MSISKNNKNSTKNAMTEPVLVAKDTSRQIELLKSQFAKYYRLIEQLDNFHKKMLKNGSIASYKIIGALVVAVVIFNSFLFFNLDLNNTKIIVSFFSIVVTITTGGVYKIIDNRSGLSKTLFDTKKGYLDKLIELDSQINVLEIEKNISSNEADTSREKKIDDLIETIVE